MNLHATLDTVIYQRKEQKPQSDVIQLVDRLKMSTEWADVALTGPDSVIETGDEILISSRPASFTFEVDGQIYNNIEDKSVIAYKHNGTLHCTRGTMLLEAPQKEEKYSAGGILLTLTKPGNKDVVWLKVAACGPQSGVKVGDSVLVAENSTAYSIEIDGKVYRNAGAEEVICYKKG